MWLGLVHDDHNEIFMLCRGASYINTSKSKEGLSEKFVTEKAPRTAVVVHKNGTLSLMQVRACRVVMQMRACRVVMQVRVRACRVAMQVRVRACRVVMQVRACRVVMQVRGEGEGESL